MNKISSEPKSNLGIEELVFTEFPETNPYDFRCPLCKKQKLTKWFVAERPFWIVEDKDSHGAELCILACYYDHGIRDNFQMEVLKYALKLIVDQYLRKPYKWDMVERSIKGHSHIQALGARLRRTTKRKTMK